MKKGDSIKFKNKKWVLVRKKISPEGVEFWRYKVYRKWFIFWISITKKTYTIFPSEWNKNKEKNI